jgi:type VI secretion system FHA domain protein
LLYFAVHRGAENKLVILTLEISSTQGAKPGVHRRQVFNEEGGTIGRGDESSLVLPHGKVSGRHAVVSYRNGVFYIEDTSRNGVSMNSAENRLTPGRPYALKSGDRLFIEPYEIKVLIAEEPANPFHDDDPFVRPEPSRLESSILTPIAEASGGDVVDPLILLGSSPKLEPARKAPAAKDLARGSLLEDHYKAPSVIPPSAPPRSDAPLIPPGYDPLAPDDTASLPSLPSAPDEPVLPAFHEASPPTPPPISRPQPAPPSVTPPPTPVGAPTAKGYQEVAPDLAEMLAGAGMDGAVVTPELMRSFGQILRVVVSGVMELLAARQQIRDEFRLRVTHFRPVGNNPLKLSVNVDDALHNLLVKRNPAFLPPVEAFEDAFGDLQNHQMAMLAGMRVAFESMLAEFDPDRLQEEFDRQLNKGSLLSVPAKLRYWDLYRDRCRDMVKDPETSFRELFGEEFAKAYEDQLKRLKVKIARDAEKDRR